MTATVVQASGAHFPIDNKTRFARVIQDYTAADGAELTLVEGDVLRVLSRVDDQWWKGDLFGDVGIFKGELVEPTDDEPSRNPPLGRAVPQKLISASSFRHNPSSKPDLVTVQDMKQAAVSGAASVAGNVKGAFFALKAKQAKRKEQKLTPNAERDDRDAIAKIGASLHFQQSHPAAPPQSVIDDMNRAASKPSIKAFSVRQRVADGEIPSDIWQVVELRDTDGVAQLRDYISVWLGLDVSEMGEIRNASVLNDDGQANVKQCPPLSTDQDVRALPNRSFLEVTVTLKSTNAPTEELGPWKAVVSDTGQTYYWNTCTDETSWEKPNIMPAVTQPERNLKLKQSHFALPKERPAVVAVVPKAGPSESKPQQAPPRVIVARARRSAPKRSSLVTAMALIHPSESLEENEVATPPALGSQPAPAGRAFSPARVAPAEGVGTASPSRPPQSTKLLPTRTAPARVTIPASSPRSTETTATASNQAATDLSAKSAPSAARPKPGPPPARRASSTSAPKSAPTTPRGPLPARGAPTFASPAFLSPASFAEGILATREGYKAQTLRELVGLAEARGLDEFESKPQLVVALWRDDLAKLSLRELMKVAEAADNSSAANAESKDAIITALLQH